MIVQSQLWANEFVLKLNLCPFAKAPMESGEIEWLVEDEPSNLLAHIEGFLEGQWTSLFMIIPAAKEFDYFLDLLAFCHDFLEKLGYEDQLRIVTFHPEHHYEGSDFEDEVNFANRSPYPMLQLLRNVDLDNLGMDERWKNQMLERNEEVLRGLGSDKLKEMLDEFRR